METIYLVGQISPKYPETYNWRKRVREEFSENEKFQIIDPCNNTFNDGLLKESKYAITTESMVSGLNILVPKDYSYVKRSSIAIVNMNQYDPNKPLIGSFFELAWYYQQPGKTVIAFADDLHSYSCVHPFVQQAVTTWCRDEYEACGFVKYYF